MLTQAHGSTRNDGPMNTTPALTPAKPATAPTIPSSEPWLNQLKNALMMVDGKPELPSGVTIGKEVAAKIPGSLETIKAVLAPGENHRKEVAVEVARLASAYPAQAASDSSAGMRSEAYQEALADLPVWAIRKTRLRIVCGGAPALSSTYCPTPPEFATQVKVEIFPYRRDLHLLEILAKMATTETPTSDGEKEKISKGFDDLRKELKPSLKPM